MFICSSGQAPVSNRLTLISEVATLLVFHQQPALVTDTFFTSWGRLLTSPELLPNYPIKFVSLQMRESSIKPPLSNKPPFPSGGESYK